MSDPKPLVVANLKANKTWQQMSVWLDQIGNSSVVKSFSGTIIIAPSAPFLVAASQKIKSANLPLKLSSQDVSKFEQGAYTGEYAASQIVDLCQYAIIGHSERRKYFSETDRDIINKTKLLLDLGITPILCVSNLKQLDTYLEQGRIIIDNAAKIIFVYEPPSAISSGGAFRPENPEDANKNAGEIDKKIGQKVITLYGGSINKDNVHSFSSQGNINGGLVGQASIDPQVFIQVIKNSKK